MKSFHSRNAFENVVRKFFLRTFCLGINVLIDNYLSSLLLISFNNFRTQKNINVAIRKINEFYLIKLQLKYQYREINATVPLYPRLTALVLDSDLILASNPIS